MNRRLVVALMVLALAPAAHAADWSIDQVRSGDYATWVESGTTDSGVVCFPNGAKVDNIGATDFTLYAATPSGTKLFELHGPVKAGSGGATSSCSPPDTYPIGSNETCGAVIVDPGCYIADPDGTGGSAQAWGGLQ